MLVTSSFLKVGEKLENLYDVIIVGGGPAGLSAAIYMARAKYRVLVLEREKIGGQITITSEVVNYPGVFETSGSELTEIMHKQAMAFGAEFQIAEVSDIETDEKIKRIKTSQGELQSLGVILAMGANPRKVGFRGEEEFQGRGVAYCATCDGEFFKGMEVYVVGGGFAAVEEGIFLTKYASHVHMIVRKDSFSCAKTVADKALNHPKVTVHFETEVDCVEGETVVSSITLLHKKTNTLERNIPQNGMGVFVFGGYVPNTKWISEKITTENGYIVTDLLGKTNIDGIYAAGDLCIKELRQVVTAVSDGATAATALEKYVENLHQELKLPEFSRSEKNCSQNDSEIQGQDSGISQDAMFLTSELKEQLLPILEQFPSTVKIVAYFSKDELADEMKEFTEEWSGISDKIIVSASETAELYSYIEILKDKTSGSGIRYYAIPSGHEFNSFVSGLYQLSGGKPLDSSIKERIMKLNSLVLKVCITLSCSMCPEVVQACQRIAMEHPKIQTNILDVSHFPEVRQKFNIMSVPCLIINDEVVHFGKKNLEEILEILENLK